MNLEHLLRDPSQIEKEINYFMRKKHIKKITKDVHLSRAHLKKARHDMQFYRLNLEANAYNDWLIVILYYAMYHCALALIALKDFYSKNHYATLLILIKEYGIDRSKATVINNLTISKEDAELYIDLKKKRHDANYTTSIMFNNEMIKHYENEVISFINRTEEMIQQTI